MARLKPDFTPRFKRDYKRLAKRGADLQRTGTHEEIFR